MSRYRAVQLYDLHLDQPVRVTLRHGTTHGTLTIEDKILDIHARTEGSRQIIDSIEFAGFIAGTSRPLAGWTVSTVEEKLPPLPREPGSVVAVDGKAAVLTGAVDEPDDIWFWADTLMGQPSPEQLQRADIIFVPQR